jgi:hypothetical protein
MIPIYRAKKIDSDELVEGYLIQLENGYMIASPDQSWVEELGLFGMKSIIDQNTLAIHFPNMIDKNGKKIFASLSEDGVGGDKLKGNSLKFVVRMSDINRVTWRLFEVIGIHKG